MCYVEYIILYIFHNFRKKGSRDSTVFTIGWIYLIGNWKEAVSEKHPKLERSEGVSDTDQNTGRLGLLRQRWLSSKPVLAQIHILALQRRRLQIWKEVDVTKAAAIGLTEALIYGFREKKPKNHYFYLSCYFERERGMYPFLFIHSNRKSINLRIQ
ncbi:hypothetical protein ACJX0J_000575 (mitochondrion) [Zea mays]